jgi:hypothetical protein
MTFQVPNTPDTAYIDQAEPDAGDFAALGERSTGVLSGGRVTAQGTPALAVDVAAATYLIAGVPFTKPSGAVALVAGESQPRFDLIVATTTSTAVVLKGAAGTNPSFPVYDPAVYCFLGSVYVRQSVSAIQATDVLDKRATVPATFNRVYTDTTTVAVSVKDSNAKTWTVKSDGTQTWMSSVLRRTADAAMELASSLVVKAADTSLVNMILRARASSPAGVNVLEVQDSTGASTLASINGSGVGQFANFKRGAGSPEGIVTGANGDLYIDTTSGNANAMLYTKVGGGNTGWTPMQQHDTTGSLLQPGDIVAKAIPAGTPVAGMLYCDGAQYSATNPTYVALYNAIGVQHGGTSGVNFNVPDYRGYALTGAGGVLNLGVGGAAGSTNGLTTISESQMPRHAHGQEQVAHTHPFYGFPYVWSPTPKAVKPYPSNLPPVNNIQGLAYMDIWPLWFPDDVKIDITILPTGGSQPMSVLQATKGVSFYVKL